VLPVVHQGRGQRRALFPAAAASHHGDPASDLQAQVTARAVWSANRAARDIWIASDAKRDPRQLVNDAFDLPPAELNALPRGATPKTSIPATC
jgi:hypothetical protein